MENWKITTWLLDDSAFSFPKGCTLTESQLKQASLYQEFLAANRARRKISDRKNAIYADKSLTPRMREQKLKPLYAEEHRVYLQFNRMYLRKMGPQAE